MTHNTPCCLECLGASNAGVHLFSFRTQKLSPVVPMVVLLWSARVGRCQDFRDNKIKSSRNGGFIFGQSYFCTTITSMIDLNKFFEKFPELMPNDEWLVLLNENFLWDNWHPLGYLFDEYFIPFSDLYFHIGNIDVSWIIGEICGFHHSNNKVYIKFDFEKMVLCKSLWFPCGGMLFGFPEFDLNKLTSTTSESVSIKERRNHKFDDLFGNKISRTEFAYNPRFSSLQIEEIGENSFGPHFFQRYYHTTFDITSWTVTHLDGKILIYNQEQLQYRKTFYLDKHIKTSQEEIKLFRIDGSISIFDWSFLTKLWYTNNELVLEWLDPKEYVSQYGNILDPLIDGEYKV